MTGDYYSSSVLNAGEEDSSATDDENASSEPSTNGTRTGRKPAPRLRIVAAVLGLLGAALALIVPFLPVKHEVTT